MPEPIAVQHDATVQQFTARLGHDVALLHYRRQGATLDLYHTAVPPAFRGRGVAEQLCRAAFEYATQEHLTVIPSCPYISGAYLTRHPEYLPLTQPL